MSPVSSTCPSHGRNLHAMAPALHPVSNKRHSKEMGNIELEALFTHLADQYSA